MNRALLLTAVIAVLALSPAAVASDAFTDVPDGAPFHDEISIFKQTNITTGCTSTKFCPGDPVRRQAMAAFIDRALGLVVRPGETTQKGVAGSRVQMLDDDVSFVGTVCAYLCLGTWLELKHAGYRVLRLEGNSSSPNVIGGFSANDVPGAAFGATIGGGGYGIAGDENAVTDNFGTVGGGVGNKAGDGTTSSSNAGYATVSGGFLNEATGQAATVPGGRLSVASGWDSFAAGTQAKADDSGSFVWSDASAVDFNSTASNQFSARAVGGVRFVSAIDGSGNPTAGVSLAAGGGSWSSLSDRNAKRDFAPIDLRGLLRRLARVPISTWSYKTQTRSTRHIGPTAQDFARAFRVGEDDRHITTVDADGVALAAIQALARENAALRAENREHEARLAWVERQLRKPSSKGAR